MNTEYAIGRIRIHFESQTRRRWFVALFYAALAGIGIAARFFAHAKDTTGMWIVVGNGVIFTALFVVFTWIGGDMRARGDEREMYRRDHAHYVAYYALLYGFVAASLYGVGFHKRLPDFLLVAFCVLFPTLPQAILLWTEPDMEVERETR